MKKIIPSDITETERLAGIPQERETPLVCVSLCGEFQVEWQEPSATEEALWDSRTSARTLLKLLLCAPGRQAPKSVLAGILWPETDEEKARESLRQAGTLLRKMLRTASGEELVEQRNNGAILKLVEQSRLWVDADAFEAVVAKASRATEADEALSLWQEAHGLLAGEFLADDQASEWVRHAWVKRRKQTLWMARCRLIRHLADLYMQRGQVSLAEEVLEQHLVRFPSDQDALYRLLVLLEQQQCYEQACILYEQTKRSLDAVGKPPTRQVKACYERIQDAINFYPLVPLAQPGVLFARSERGKPEHSAPASVVTPVLSHGRPEGSEAAFISSTSQLASLLNIDGPSTSMQDVLRILLEGEGRQDVSLLSRRQCLELGIAAFITRLAQLDSTRISAVEREALGHTLGQSIADGWKLFHTIGNAKVLAVGQAQLSLIHQAHPLLQPSTRSYLYAGAYGLIGSALQLQERNAEALHAYHHAHLASVATGDPWYIVQNLICQANTYQALGRLAEAIQTLEEASSYLGHTEEEHRRTRAHLLGCWADAALTMREYPLAQKKLDEAANYLDQISASEEFDHGSWVHLAGKYAFATGKHQTAITYFEQALAESSVDWVIRRVLVLLPMMASYACEREYDPCVATAEAASSALGVLNAPSLNRTFITTLQEILKAFPNDAHLRSLMMNAQHSLTI